MKQSANPIVENPMVLPLYLYKSPESNLYHVGVNRCGYGKVAKFEVYEDKQAHCEECLNDALDCEGQILVGVL